MDPDRDNPTPPDGEDTPTDDLVGEDPSAGGPPSEAADAEPPPRVWDAERKRWVSEVEADTPAPSQPTPETTTESPPLPDVVSQAPARTTPPAPPPAVASEPLPHWLAVVLAGSLGAVLGIVVMLFFPGPADPRDGTGPRAGGDTSTLPDFDPVEIGRDARPMVVGVTGRVPDEPARSGSGVLIGSDGIIATVQAVVEEATVEVTLPDGRTVTAEVLGADPHTGIAILRADVVDQIALPRGSAEFIRLGEPAVTVAQQERFASVTSGVITEIGRPVTAGDGRRLLNAVRLDRDVPSNGALVVGIGGTALGLTTPVANGVVVPIDLVWFVHDHVTAGRDVDHPYIGLVATELEDDPRLPSDTLALAVVDVLNGGPAAEAGLRRGDLIVGVAGERIDGGLTLLSRLLDEGGNEIQIALLREGQIEVVTVPVQRRAAVT